VTAPRHRKAVGDASSPVMARRTIRNRAGENAGSNPIFESPRSTRLTKPEAEKIRERTAFYLLTSLLIDPSILYAVHDQRLVMFAEQGPNKPTAF